MDLWQVYRSVEEVVAADDLQLVYAGEGGGKRQRGRPRGNYGRIDHHAITVHDVQRTAVAGGSKVQCVVVKGD